MATRKAEKKAENTLSQVHWGFWFGVTFFVAVIIAILSFSLHLNSRMTAEESSPVTSIVISGEMNYTTRSEIELALEQVDLGNFFKLDVNQVQKEVLSLPWVYSVSVRKKWPNELKMYVVDQTPIATWNGDFLINQFGRTFQADALRLGASLPAFYGPEGSELIALAHYEKLNKAFVSASLEIDELMLSERFSWRVTLSDGVSVKLGREDNEERVKQFISVYTEIKKHETDKRAVDYVDLRYDTGLAVGWKTKQEKERV